MSVVHNYGKEEILINTKEKIIIETKGEDGYEWNEVEYEWADEKIYIGSYYNYNYSISNEWMEYNEKYIILLIVYKYGYEKSDTQVKKIFDIKSKRLIERPQEELLEIYNQEFKGIIKKKTLTHKQIRK